MPGQCITLLELVLLLLHHQFKPTYICTFVTSLAVFVQFLWLPGIFKKRRENSRKMGLWKIRCEDVSLYLVVGISYLCC